jgi:methionyl-tRNA formyltransferase
MRMEAGLDTGPIYIRRALPVGDNESAGELHDRLALLGGEVLAENLVGIVSGAIPAEPQDDALATYANKISKHDGRIVWLAAAEEIARKIRAYNPVPGAVFDHGGESVKCFRAQPLAADAAPAGTVIAADKHGVTVACGSGALRLDEVQRPGRRRISGAEFAAQTDLVGRRFGWLS